MAYIEKLISDDEELLVLARVHWFYTFQGLMWFLLPFFLWVAFEAYVFLDSDIKKAPLLVQSFEIIGYVFAALSVAGAVIFLFSFIHQCTAEVALTTRRVIYKTHWIFVNIRELDLEEIKAAHIDNGWMGRFLDYGHVFLDSRFVDNLQIYTTRHAYDFVKRVNKAREVAKHGPVRDFLEESPSHSLSDPRITRPTAPEQREINTHLSPLKRKRLHDRILDSFRLSNWRKK